MKPVSRVTALALVALALAASVGCNTASPFVPVPISVSAEDKPEALQDGYRALVRDGFRNFVLNEMEIGLDAYQLGEEQLSTESLDYALDAIESVWGDDEAAVRARKLWHSEGCKNFKGEPYERAMAYYYRGLLYITNDEIDSARACFRAAILQDAFAEEQQDKSDFALMLYLEAWCNYRLDDPGAAEEVICELRKIRPDCRPPAPDGNLLIVAETGRAPRKIREGVSLNELVFCRGDACAEATVRTAIDGATPHDLCLIEDIYWQASSRGGRPVDRILEGKAQFKENWDAAGSALTGIGSHVMVAGAAEKGKRRRNVQAVAGGLIIAGIIADLIALNVNPRADIRAWRNLPEAVHVLAVPCPSGDHAVEFTFADASGEQVARARSKVAVAGTGAALVWARSPTQMVSGTPREE